MEIVLGTVWTAQAQSIELQNAFEVREQHLDPLSPTAWSNVGVVGGDVAGEVASPFMVLNG